METKEKYKMKNIYALNQAGRSLLQSAKRKLVMYFLAITMINAEAANNR